MSGRTVELLVIGGGISGLGFAHLANHRGIATQVLEASNSIGGAIRSHQFATSGGPFWTELGAHTCYNSYGNFLQILEDTGQLGTLRPKQKLRYRIQTADGLRSIPSQLSYVELLGVLPRLLMTKKVGRSAGDYFGAIMGRRNFQRVLGPALDAVVCQSAKEFPADSLFRKKPRRKEIIRSYTGQAGLQSFMEKIVNQPGLAVDTNSAVARIEALDDGYRVFTKETDPITATHLVLAIAPDVAAGLLQPNFPQLAEPLSQIEMAEIESLAVLLGAEALELPPLAGIIGRDDDFYSVVSRDLVPDPRHRAFTFHFRPGRLDRSAKMARIQAVLGVTEDAIQGSAACGNRLPALRLGHQQRIEKVDQALAGTRMALTGNWFAGVSIEDSLVRSAKEFARLFPSE